MCVKERRVRVDEARDRLQTKTKHYNKICNLIIYIMAPTALFKNLERLLCLARQFIICVSNKDKRINELDIKSPKAKNTARIFLRLNNSKIALTLVQLRGMKTVQKS